MENITIVLYSTLTVPAIYGGAVETLLESFLDENEQNKYFNITVIAHNKKNVKELSRKYKQAKFIYISWPTILIRANSVLINLSKMEFLPDLWDELLISRIKKAGNKKVLVEGSSRFILKLKRRLPSMDIYYHLHADILPFRNADELRIYDKVKKICVSNYIRECQIKAGVDAKNVFAAVNGIQTAHFNMDKIKISKRDICKKFGLNHNKKFILFKGRLIKEKGILELIRAFKLLDCDDAVLLICGSTNFGEKRIRLTDYEQRLRDEIKDCNRIKMTGFIPYDEVPLLHKVADICVVPSIWQEPCGLVVIEAIVSGVPLVCSNMGGSGQLCENSGAIMVNVDDNYVQTLKDAMKELLENEEKRQNISKMEKMKKEYFDIHRYYEDMSDILLNQ